MKKPLFFLLVLLASVTSFGQNADAQLTQRINHYLQLNKEKNFEKLMDYMHPALYTIAPKEAMQQMLEQTFNNEEMQINIDSLQLLNLGADFKEGEAVYKKVDYFMSMSMVFKENMLEDESFREMVLASMQESFDTKKVSYDAQRKALIISGNEIMFAVKDNAKAAWLFLGYEKNPDMIKAIFPKGVIAHYKLL